MAGCSIRASILLLLKRSGAHQKCLWRQPPAMVAHNLWRQRKVKMPLLVEYIRGFGRFQRTARLYLISFALSGVSVGIILVLYNLYLVSLGYNTDFVGFVLFAGYLGAALAIFPAGICIDRFGGKLILIWASVAVSIAA